MDIIIFDTNFSNYQEKWQTIYNVNYNGFYIFQGTATKDTYYKQSYSLVLESGVKLCLQGKFSDEFRDLC